MIERVLFNRADPYTLTQLNDVVLRLAGNDNYLLTLVTQLEQFLSTSPFPPGIVKTPAQMSAWVDMILDSGNTNERLYSVVPPEQDRYIGEISHLFTIEPFKSLIEGVKLNPQQWLPMMRIITILKGMTYLVYDGPNYETDPVLIPDGSFVYTSITDDNNQNLVCSTDGTPAELLGKLVFRSLPIGIYPITLMEFMVRRLMFRKLRELYRISNFEVGVDDHHNSSYAWDIAYNAFQFGIPEQLPRRYPCGFTKAGDLLFLRTEATRYRGTNLLQFIPDPDTTNGVEDRVVMEESLLQTPMGVIRIPKSVIRWGHLLSNSNRARSTEFGDPIIFIGLKVSIRMAQTGAYQDGAAWPKSVEGSGFINGVDLLEKLEATPFTNLPHFTGTNADAFKVMGNAGHQHGNLRGFIQQDGSNPAFAQYGQISVEPVVAPFEGQTFVNEVLNAAETYPSEADVINSGEGYPPDTVPNRLMSLTSRKVIGALNAQGFFPDFDADYEQGVMIHFYRFGSDATWECVIPLFLHLYKNEAPFDLNNLNGCTTRFTDGWAIRVIKSVQPGLNSVTFDDGNGQPEGFPDDFMGSQVTIFKADGMTVSTTIIERTGDKLAKLTSGALEGVAAGDVVTFDRRVPSASLDGVYLREAAKTNLVDIRPRSERFIDPEIYTSAEGIVSPSPDPAVPWTGLKRTFNQDLATASLSSFKDAKKAIDQKIRWNHLQMSPFKASERRDLIRLDTVATELEATLLRWVKEYDNNSPHDWIAGENAIIHWPAKEAVTKVRMSRYLTPAVPGQEDGITVEDVENWGSVPVFTRHLRTNENYRYPMLMTSTLLFASEKSFTIPGHTKFSGSFSLKPLDTWVVDDTVTINLYQTINQNGSYERVKIGSVQFNWRRAKSFVNATGVFRIDGDARYEPTSQYLKINYNQIIDFTQDQPGSVEILATYHDLSQVHPIYMLDISTLGLQVSHLFDATAWYLNNGVFEQIPDLTMRLEGLSIVDQIAYLRFNREDVFNLISKRGFIRTRWVLAGIPVIRIDTVTYDIPSGQPTALTYTAEYVDTNMTMSTLLANETRCNQFYQPCKLKYGWADLAQNNIHTEAQPIDNNPKFGFFQKKPVIDDSGALLISPVTFTFAPTDIDYRFLAPYDITDMQSITSMAILKNIKTGEIRPITGVYLDCDLSGSSTDLINPIDLTNVLNQGSLFIRDTEMIPSEWTVEFAGVLVTVKDDAHATSPDPMDIDSKLNVVGYWYAGHDVKDRMVCVRARNDIIQFNVSTIVKDGTRYRVGDVPQGYLYRGNNILEASRKRPV